jgi:glutathione S-transferase
MDRKSGMYQIILYQPTPLIELAFQFKQIPYTPSTEPRTRLLELDGPALEFQTTFVVSEPAILGWLDKRYPYPELFPNDPATYARACTLTYAMEQNPTTAGLLWETHETRTTPFLIGDDPCIADLALLAKLQKVDAIRPFKRRVLAYGGD